MTRLIRRMRYGRRAAKYWEQSTLAWIREVKSGS